MAALLALKSLFQYGLYPLYFYITGFIILLSQIQLYIKPYTVKKLYFLSFIFIILSCDMESTKNQLLDSKIDGQYFSFNGFAEKYTDYINDQKTGYEYQVYNHDRHSFRIEAYDITFTKVIFPFLSSAPNILSSLMAASPKPIRLYRDSSVSLVKIMEISGATLTLKQKMFLMPLIQ